MPINPNTTVGTEIEFYRLGASATDGLKGWLRFHLHNDGSVRDATYLALNLPVVPEEDSHGTPILSAGMRQQASYGLEVITEPYTFEEFRPLSQKIAYFFSLTPQNPRTSIHVHVDMHQESWKTIQHTVIWAHALEAIIYRIACGGQVHRGCRSYQGSANDHKFARPLSDPIGVDYVEGKRGPLILWNEFINAKNATDMMAAWGRLDLYWPHGLEHYMPHRVHMVNLASILRTGTFEWRVFDGLYSYFDVLVDFVYHVHALAAKGKLPDFEFPLGSSPGVDAAWVSNLLDMDVSRLWGENWQKGCKQKAPLSHYNPVMLYPKSVRGVTPLVNARGQMDDNTAEYVPYIRRD